MGLRHFAGKAGKGLKHLSGFFTKTGGKKHHKTTRAPHSKRAKRRAEKAKYPIISALKLKESVPSAVLQQLSTYSQDTSSNGAVQKVTIPGLNVTAYSVIVMTDNAMSKAGLNPHSSDLGELSAEISNGYIEPAALGADIRDGKLAVIPSHKSLGQLESFNSMNKIKFRWGLFFDSFNDTSDSNQVRLLKTPVTLAQLINYDKVQPHMTVKDHNLFMGQGDSESSADENTQQDASKIPSEHPDSSDKRDNTPSSIPSSSEADSSQNNSKANSSSITLPNMNQTNNNSTSKNNSQSQSQEANSLPHLNPNSSQVSSDANQDSLSNNGLSNSAEQIPLSNKNLSDSNSDSRPDMNSSNNLGPQLTSDYSSDNDDFDSQDVDADEDPALKSAMAEAGDVSEPGTSRTQRYNDMSEPNTDPKKFASRVNNFVNSAYYDKNLGVKADLSDLQKTLDSTKPLQFQLKPIRKGDKMAHFKRILNAIYIQKNKELSQKHDNNKQHIMNSAIDTLNKVSDKVRKYLNPDDKKSLAYRKKQEIDEAYGTKKTNTSGAVDAFKKSQESSYKHQKASYASNAVAKANSDFDRAHHGQLLAILDEADTNMSTGPNQFRASKLHDLKQWRTRKAQDTLDSTVRRLEERAHNTCEAYHDKEKSLYDKDNKEIKHIIAKYLNHEIENINAITYDKKHDHKVDELKKRNRSIVADYKRKIQALKDSSRQDTINAVRDEQDRTRAIIRNNSMIRRQLYDVRKAAQRAGSVIPPKYSRELKMKDARYRDLQKQNKEDNERYNQQLDNLTKSIRREDNTNRSHNWYTLAIASAISVVLLICGLAIGHATTHSHTHYIHVGTPSSRGYGGNHTTINNGNTQPETNKSSSKTGNTSSHTGRISNSAKRAARNANVNRSLMTHRPPARSGLYIGTSTGHHPTSFMYVLHKHMYNKGQHLQGFKNHSVVTLTVTRVYKNMVFVRDPTNNAYYEFNMY